MFTTGSPSYLITYLKLAFNKNFMIAMILCKYYGIPYRIPVGTRFSDRPDRPRSLTSLL